MFIYIHTVLFAYEDSVYINVHITKMLYYSDTVISGLYMYEEQTTFCVGLVKDYNWFMM